MNAQPQPTTSASYAAFLGVKPIRLPLSGGRVSKSDIANELGFSTDVMRLRLAPILDSNPCLGDCYKRFRLKKLIPADLAEKVIRELLDNPPGLCFDFYTPQQGRRATPA